MSAAIPVKAFAIAADLAAQRFGETVADLFDDGPSRARFVAIAALITLYPNVAQVDIARCFGWAADGRQFAGALTGARASAWWRKSDVSAVIKATRDALTDMTKKELVDGREPIATLSDRSDVARQAGENDPRARLYQPRNWRAARLVCAALCRPHNITAALLGDPPPGRREFIAGLNSPAYVSRPSERAR